MVNNSIRHMVIFSLKYQLTDHNTVKFLHDSQEILSSIPGVIKFEVLKQVSNKNEYDFGFSMEFSNKVDYDSYNQNPLHVAFVNERWNAEVTRFLEIDFEDYA